MNITTNDVAAFMKDIQIDATSFPGKAFELIFEMPEEDVGIMTFNKCCAPDQWEALGRPDILEKNCHSTCPASLIETAKMYNPNMKVDILAIPPRVDEATSAASGSSACATRTIPSTCRWSSRNATLRRLEPASIAFSFSENYVLPTWTPARRPSRSSSGAPPGNSPVSWVLPMSPHSTTRPARRDSPRRCATRAGSSCATTRVAVIRSRAAWKWRSWPRRWAPMSPTRRSRARCSRPISAAERTRAPRPRLRTRPTLTGAAVVSGGATTTPLYVVDGDGDDGAYVFVPRSGGYALALVRAGGGASEACRSHPRRACDQGGRTRTRRCRPRCARRRRSRRVDCIRARDHQRRSRRGHARRDRPHRRVRRANDASSACPSVRSSRCSISSRTRAA